MTSVLLKYANLTGCVIILSFFVIIGFTLTTGISLKDLSLFLWGKFLGLCRTIAEDLKEGGLY